jgi:hypothetical protein
MVVPPAERKKRAEPKDYAAQSAHNAYYMSGPDAPARMDYWNYDGFFKPLIPSVGGVDVPVPPSYLATEKFYAMPAIPREYVMTFVNMQRMRPNEKRGGQGPTVIFFCACSKQGMPRAKKVVVANPGAEDAGVAKPKRARKPLSPEQLDKLAKAREMALAKRKEMKELRAKEKLMAQKDYSDRKARVAQFEADEAAASAPSGKKTRKPAPTPRAPRRAASST